METLLWVQRLIDGTIWQGQTQEQVLDSLGKPLDVDQKVMKKCVRETWKYKETGRNRYALKIVIEDGIVSGWDSK